jgi:carboxyl-terminal processing protease
LTTARYYTPNGTSIQLSGITPDILMEFVPVDENEGEQKKRRFMREEDLKGHIPNEKTKEEALPDEGELSETERRVKLLLEKDNQVRHAVQLLETWNIFTQIRPGP